MNPFKTFDRVYCLNLEDRLDRWNICLEYFNKYNIDNYHRFLGKRVKPEDVSSVSQKRLGQLGCMLSFCEMIDDAIKKDYDSVVFLEDDFEFIEPLVFNEKIKLSLQELPIDWDIYYLGANVIGDFFSNPLEEFSDNLFKLNSAFTTHSFCLSRKGLREIKISLRIDPYNFGQDFFVEMSKYEAIDVFLAKNFQHSHKSFISNELLSLQRPDFSSIENCFYDFRELMINRFEFFKKNIKR
jgi:hypothetical protein